MARRNNKSDEQNVPTNEAEATEATEAQTAEATEPQPTPEPEIDLTNFISAAQAAVAEADGSTGSVPEAEVAKVNDAYRALDGLKAKNKARSWIEEQMIEAINDAKNIQLARSFVELKNGLSAGSSSRTERTPADPTAAFVQRVAAVQLAAQLVSQKVPEGVSEDWSQQVAALMDEVAPQVEEYRKYVESDDEDAEQPDVSPVVRQAFKFSAGKSSGTRVVSYSGPRRDTEKHIVQVFENLEPGTFLTVNEIAKAKSTEYGDDNPSSGAVSQRLFPKGKPPYNDNGIQALAEEGKSRGAVKL